MENERGKEMELRDWKELFVMREETFDDLLKEIAAHGYSEKIDQMKDEMDSLSAAIRIDNRTTVREVNRILKRGSHV